MRGDFAALLPPSTSDECVQPAVRRLSATRTTGKQRSRAALSRKSARERYLPVAEQLTYICRLSSAHPFRLPAIIRPPLSSLLLMRT